MEQLLVGLDVSKDETAICVRTRCQTADVEQAELQCVEHRIKAWLIEAASRLQV